MSDLRAVAPADGEGLAAAVLAGRACGEQQSPADQAPAGGVPIPE